MRMLAPSFIALLAIVLGAISAPADGSEPPNVVLIMTDDQGHGDLGAHGNPILRTPNLDRFTEQSVKIDDFYVSPVCAPTRASLMTGRYNYRTGAVDTYLGRAMMHPDEVTIAEMLKGGGYRTGIFGKWHLGDNAPMRPQDQGFDEVLVHFGGGIGQPSDPPVPGGSSYFDPVLQHNGEQIQTEGYVSDVITTAAINFFEEPAEQPFFVYLSFNAPHTPLQVAEQDLAPYLEMDLSHDQFPDIGQPLPGEADQETTAKIYGMVTNIDDNVGRLLEALEDRGLADNTLVIFLTDNGPQQVRYNSGLRGRKGSVYEGGIRVPFYLRWPGKLEAGQVVEEHAAHIDVVPTLLAACGVSPPEEVELDGRNLLPLLEGTADDWPDRTLYFQWHRGDEPEPFRGFAARDSRYKLVRAEQRPLNKQEPTFELFDIQADPFEQFDIAEENPEVVDRLRSEYEQWFRDVSSIRGYDPPRIHLGSPKENPTVLTRQDWRGPKAGWGPKDLGFWEVDIIGPGLFDVTLLFDEPKSEAAILLRLANIMQLSSEIDPNATRYTFEAVDRFTGPARLEVEIQPIEGEPYGVKFVEVYRREND
ncbi:arylsulfatase [soil metagenome]